MTVLRTPLNAYGQQTKFAPVAPYWVYADLLHWGGRCFFRDYFLLLAHDVVKYPNKYNDLFRRANRPYTNTTVILDNSVIELGGAVDLHMVYEAQKICEADVVVLPDVLKDGQATIKSTLDALDPWTDLIEDADFMAVPQGASRDDFSFCLAELAKYRKFIGWVGVPRNATGRLAPSRWPLIDETRKLFPKAKIHLLGFSDNMSDDFHCCKHPDVYGIDSAVPLRLADQGVPMSLNADPGPRGDWWDSAGVSLQTIRNLETTNHLISGCPNFLTRQQAEAA